MVSSARFFLTASALMLLLSGCAVKSCLLRPAPIGALETPEQIRAALLRPIDNVMAVIKCRMDM